jgi:hypothetical protein
VCVCAGVPLSLRIKPVSVCLCATKEPWFTRVLLFSYLCAGLRGVSADIIIMEEAAFINRALFFSVIVPLMGVNGTAVIAISTPNEHDDNYYTFLMDLKNPTTNAPLFKTIRIGLACEKCVAAGTGAQCNHNRGVVPPWKSLQRQDLMRTIMEADSNLFMRENMGMLCSNTQFLFMPKLVNQFHSASPRQRKRRPHVVFVCIDPSGGGTQSDYAICSICVEDGHHHVIGLDHTDAGHVETVNELVVNHMRALRKLPDMEGVCLIVYIEANMSWIEADRLSLLCTQPALQPVIVESRDPKGKHRAGVVTDEHNKVGYVSGLQCLLQEQRITYAQDIASRDVHECKKELETQMRAFKRAVKVPDQPEHQKYHVALTGKGYGRKDDLVMALMMACYWSFVTIHDSAFADSCTKRGWIVG